MMGFRRSLDRRALAGAAATAALVAATLAAPTLFRDEIGEALAALAGASPKWLWLGALAFATTIGCMGSAWRAGLAACGGDPGPGDCTARYAAGSLVNAALPPGSGGAVRIALFSRVLDAPDRLWTAGGVAAALGAARALALLGLVVVAAAVSGFPLWPVLLLGAAVAAAVALALAVRRRTPHRRVAHVLDAFRALGRSPGDAATVVAWVALATLARVAAAACVATALGAPAPLRLALIAIPALALATVLPLTPGNVGVASGAVALALHASGVDGTTALSVGLAFHALETGVSLIAGGAALLYLARPPAWALRVAVGCACLAVVGGFGVTVLA